MAAADVLAVVPPEDAAAAIQAVGPEMIERMATALDAEQTAAIADALPAKHAERFRRARRAACPAGDTSATGVNGGPSHDDLAHGVAR